MPATGYLSDDQVQALDAEDVHLPGDAPPEPPPAAEPEQTTITGGELVHLAEGVDLPAIMPRDEFYGLAAQARVLASGALVPKALRGKPADVFLVLLTGRDLGITATSALRSCYPIDGKVSLAPALKKALIERQGLGAIRPPSKFMPDADGRLIPDPDYPNNRTRATAVVSGPDGHEMGRVQVTWEDVKDVAENGKKLVEKANWKNYPQRMLWWRACGFACDDYFSGVAYGLYSPDEIGGFIDGDGHVLDVDSVEVPEGYDRQREQARTDPPLAADGAAYAQRATLLPKGARDLFRGFLHERNIPTPLSDAPSSKRSIIDAMLSTLESRARGGEWGEWTRGTPAEPDADAAPDDTVDAVIVCNYCNEAPCVCAPEASAADETIEPTGTVCGTCGDDPCTCPL